MFDEQPITSPELEAARHLLFHYGQPGGYEPGSFSTQLIRLLELADSTNKAKLLLTFPQYQRPVAVCQTQGAAKLAEIVHAATTNTTN